MAEVGTSTDRDELAMNKCRLEIRGSSVLRTIPHGLVGELSSQRTQVTAELVCSLSCGETLLCTSHLSPVADFLVKLEDTYNEIPTLAPALLSKRVCGCRGAEKGRTALFLAGARCRALSAAPRGLTALSPLLWQDRVTPGAPGTSDAAEDG